MTFWAEVFLGVIAAATLASAILHIATLVGAAMLARRIKRLVDDVERQLKPAFAHLDAIGRDATRASALAVTQVERLDGIMAGLAVRIDEVLATMQEGLRVPGREARAMMTGIRAALVSLREMRVDGRRRSGADDEDALFI